MNAGSNSVAANDMNTAPPGAQNVKVQAQALGNSLSTAMQIDWNFNYIKLYIQD